MSTRKTPPVATVKALFAKSLNRCAYPNCHRPIVDDATSTVVGDISHIEGIGKRAARYNPNRPAETLNHISNLVLFCGEHHRLVDDKKNGYTVAMLQQMKRRHEAQGRLEIIPEDSEHAKMLLDARKRGETATGTVYRASQIFAASGNARQNIVFNNYGQKRPPDVIPDDAIAHDSQKSGYIQHLIDRYIDFDASLTRDKHQSGIKISQSIRRKFGRKAMAVSLSFFTYLVQFLQRKIDNTIPGRKNVKLGQKNYSSFEDWIIGRGV
jgi:hypothetical protein